MESLKKYVDEFIGTFVLVLFACGVAALTKCKVPEAGYIATALAFGLVIVAMAYSIGNISGCHINPGLYIGDAGISFLIEIILTFVFVIAILGVTSKTENSSVAGMVIGLALVLVHLFGIPLTGTSVNPARSFGPALFVGGEAMTNVWVFVLAPLVGGIIAAIVYKFLSSSKKK